MQDGLGRDEARKYFEDCGLTYDNVNSGDICVLVMILQKNIKQACKKNEMSTYSMRMSEKIKAKYKTNGNIRECFLYMNSHYFTQRKCIFFNNGGFIGFASWADDRNVAPILKSFIEWCDYLKKQQEETEDIKL